MGSKKRPQWLKNITKNTSGKILVITTTHRIINEDELKHFPAFTAVGYVLKPESEIDIRENGAYWLGKDFSGVSKEAYAKLSAAGRGEVGL